MLTGFRRFEQAMPISEYMMRVTEAHHFLCIILTASAAANCQLLHPAGLTLQSPSGRDQIIAVLHANASSHLYCHMHLPHRQLGTLQ